MQLFINLKGYITRTFQANKQQNLQCYPKINAVANLHRLADPHNVTDMISTFSWSAGFE